jgi:dCMP deaminase
MTIEKKKVAPRDVPSRDDFYMNLAFWMSAKSKDPKTQVGAILVNTNNRPLGWGYNGPPRQIKDSEINWDRPEKYDFMEHAEENAIDHSFESLEGGTMYVTAKPCKKCMLKIVKFGIKKVIYFNFVSKDKGSTLSAESAINLDKKVEEIANLGGVTLELYKGNLNWVRDRITFMEEIGVFE